jgi:hypothetical protein
MGGVILKKSSAYFGFIITAIIAVYGIAVYSSGDYYIKWFGIRLSGGGFAVLICAFILYDIIAFVSSRKAAQKKDQTRQETLDSAAQLAASAEQLDVPCDISITRKASAAAKAATAEVFLNGKSGGFLTNGGTLTFQTSASKNRLTVCYQNNLIIKSIDFDAASGGKVQLSFDCNMAKLAIVTDAEVGV